MANFFLDNDDIQFLFEHMELRHLAALYEEGFRFSQDHDFAPQDAEDAVDNYRRILSSLGELAAEVIAPTAAQTDRVGNVLNEDGSVSYAPGITEAMACLGQADLMGFTLPVSFRRASTVRSLVYTMSNEIVSRADASLMNLYGLQGIAETINAFADETIRQDVPARHGRGREDRGDGPDGAGRRQRSAGGQGARIPGRHGQLGSCRASSGSSPTGAATCCWCWREASLNLADARGLSLFLVERGPRVKVRRLEEKLGIHGSPTCELFFDDAPARLIGERQRGLITYVMSLMNGARVGIAAQSLGIGEAAYRVASEYAHSRQPVRGGDRQDSRPFGELLVEMSVDLQAARALTYYASFCVDVEVGTTRRLEGGGSFGEAETRRLQQEARRLRRINSMLTPMSKYFASEMSMRVANNAIAVLGGSGYMKDYSVERHLRDSRITTIYEGTSQLQVVAALGSVSTGLARGLVEQLLDGSWPQAMAGHVEQVRGGLALLDEAVGFAKGQAGAGYLDLYGRKIVDMACTLVVAALLCKHAAASERKLAVMQHWLAVKMPELRMNRDLVCSGDEAVLGQFETLVDGATLGL